MFGRKKKCEYYRDTRRVCVDMDIHACRVCGGWETKPDDRNIRFGEAILHEPGCKFYPSLANVELEERLKEQGIWERSKWNQGRSNG